MSTAAPRTPEEYLARLPDDRREALTRVRQVIRDSLPEGYREGIGFGMIGYVVPLERFAETYNGQPLMYAALANQKNYMTLHLMSVYSDPARKAEFTKRLAVTGRRPDMGKACVRFRRLDELPLDLVAETISSVPVDAFIAQMQEARSRSRRDRSAATASASASASAEG